MQARRVFVKSGKVVLGLLAGVTVLLVAAWGALQTRWGGDLVRRKALEAVNANVVGRLDARRFAYRGRTTALEDVVLADEAGRPVARVARLEVRFHPLSLIGGRLDVSSVRIVDPDLRLVQDARGLNLSRAIAARKPTPKRTEATKGKSDSGGGMTIDVRDVTISGGRIDFRQRGAEAGAPELHVAASGLAARARLRLEGDDLSAALDLDGALQAPTAGPLRLAVDGKREGDALNADVKFVAADTSAELTATARGTGPALAATAELRKVVVGPRLLRGFVPSSPLIAKVTVEGRVRHANETITPDLRINAGGGRLQIAGAVDLKRLAARDLRLRGREIDLDALVRAAPDSSIDLDVLVDGGVPSAEAWDRFRGRATLEARGRVIGERLGPISARIKGEGAGPVALSLSGALPGLTVTAGGSVSKTAVDLRGDLVLRDLKRLARALSPDAALAGRGRLAFAARGPLTAPTVFVDGALPRLVVGGAGYSNLRLRGDLAASGAVGLDVRLGAPGPLQLALRAQRSVDPARSGEEIRFDSLSLTYPGARWALARPALVTSAGERIEVRGVRLRAGGQAIDLDLTKRGPRIDGQLRVMALALDRLPSFVVPTELRLGGRLGLDVRVRGPLERADIQAKVALERGRFRTFEGLGLAVEADVQDGRRARGTLAAEGIGLDIDGRFDLPLSWPPPRRAPLRLELASAPIDLPSLFRALGTKAPQGLAGKAEVDLRVGGTGAAPTLALVANGRSIALAGRRFGDVALRIEDPEAGPLGARVELAGLGRANWARVGTPFELGTLLHTDPKVLQRRFVEGRAPLSVDVLVDELPAPALAALLGRNDPKGGTITLKANLDGPPLALIGEIDARVRGLSAQNFPPTDGGLLVKLGAADITTQIDVRRRDRSLLAARGRLIAPAQGRHSLAALKTAPLSFEASLGPVALQRLGMAPADMRQPPRVLHGLLAANVTVKGTVGAPRVDLSAQGTDLRLDAKALGQATLHARYADARPTLDLKLASATGGGLRLSASAEADLSPAALGRPDRRWEATPIKAQLDADGFDLGWLSGFVRLVPVIDGRFHANLLVQGAAAAPRARGRVEVRDAALTTIEYGKYEDVRMIVRADEQSWVLEELTAKSEEGRARITGKLARAGEAHTLAMTLKAKDFAVRSEGQRVATVSIDARADGRLSDGLLAITPLHIKEAHIEVAPGKRKNLQSLDRPEDIVLVRDGEPLNRYQRRKLERLRAQRAEEASAGDAPPAGAAPSALAVRVGVKAPRNLWIRAKDTNIELGLAEGFRVALGGEEPEIFGEVQVIRGTLELLGKRFELGEDSAVRFAGGPESLTLDVQATHTVQATQGGGPIVVTARVGGSRENPKFELTSESGLTEAEIVTLLVTGRTSLDRSTGGANASTDEQAVSILGGVLANQLQQRLSDRLPLDVLSIQTGEGLTSAVLEAGTYLTQRLYVSYIGRLGADPQRYENRNSVHLEYQLTPRWSFEGEYGDARTGSADVVWKKHY